MHNPVAFAATTLLAKIKPSYTVTHQNKKKMGINLNNVLHQKMLVEKSQELNKKKALNVHCVPVCLDLKQYVILASKTKPGPTNKALSHFNT